MILTVAASVVAQGQTEETWKELLRRSDSLLQEGNREGAVAATDSALIIAERLFGPRHLNMATALIARADAEFPSGAYLLMGTMVLRHRIAADYLVQALSIQEENLGHNHTDILPTLQRLTELLIWHEWIEEGLGYARRALAIQQQAPIIPRELARTLSTIGHLFDGAHNIDSAIYYRRQLLALQREYPETGHLDIRSTVMQIVLSFQQIDRYDSVEYYQRLLLELLKTKPGNMASVAMQHRQIASTCFQQGKFTEAIVEAEEELRIHREMRDTFNMIMVYRMIASCRSEMDEHAKAIRIYSQALDISMKARETYLWQIPNLMNAIAHEYALLKDYKRAELTFLQALAIIKQEEEWLGSSINPEYSYIQIGLAELYATQKRYVKAEKIYRELVTLLREKSDYEDTSLAEALDSYAAMCRQLGRIKEAETMAKQAAEFRGDVE